MLDHRTPWSTSIVDPLHRYIIRCLVHTLGARKDGPSAVNTRDLFHLFCIIDGHDCNLAYSLAVFFKRATGTTKHSHIFGGHFVTLLARSLGVLTPENLEVMTVVPSRIEKINIRRMNRRGIWKSFEGTYRLVNNKGDVWQNLNLNLPAGDEGDEHDPAVEIEAPHPFTRQTPPAYVQTIVHRLDHIDSRIISIFPYPTILLFSIV